MIGGIEIMVAVIMAVAMSRLVARHTSQTGLQHAANADAFLLQPQPTQLVVQRVFCRRQTRQVTQGA